MRISWLILHYLNELCWRLMNGIYAFVQRHVVWQLTAVGARRREIANMMQRQAADPSGGIDMKLPAAQALRVIARFKVDAYLRPALISDFMAVHEGFETPEFLLQDHVTLYCVNDTEAVFVEARRGLDLWRASVSPFIMASQFINAVRILRLPIDGFHALADRLGNPRGCLVFLTNTARCGSTLLNQMFEATGRVVSISEPSSLNLLALLVEKGRSAELDRAIVSSVRVMCKPTRINEIAHVLKLTAPTMQGLYLLDALFPDAKKLFMYRDSLKVAQSLYRLSEELPALKAVFTIGKGSKRRLSLAIAAMGMPAEDYQFELHHDLSVGAMLWAASLRKYAEFRDKGMDVVAVRYEDLAADPVRSMRRILAHCGLPEELAELSKQALNLDSQRSTPFAGHILNRHRILEYSGAAKVECDAIMDSLGAARLGAPYIAPATITYSPADRL